MLKISSRYFRFSLRAMLIAMTLLAIVLGIVVYRAERQRAAVAWVTAHDGHIFYAHENTDFGRTPDLPAPQWLIDALGDHYFFQPQHMLFHGLTPDEDVKIVARLNTVERISILRSELTAEHVKQFCQMPQLKDIQLSNVKLENDSLAELRQATALETLNISCCRLNASDTKSALSVPTVKQLFFNQCEIDLSEVGDCAELRQLEVLYIANGTIAKSRDFSQLGSLPKLWQVIISADWSPATYAALSKQPSLHTIHVEGGWLSEDKLAYLLATPKLKELGCSCSFDVGATFRAKEAFPNVKFVNYRLSPSRNQKYDFDTDEYEWQSIP